MPYKKQHQTGFTLIEVTITVLVMGILAAVAVPTYITSIARYRANMAARRIVADLHYARSEAQRMSQNRTVQFDTGSNSYTLTSVTDLDRSANGYEVALVAAPFSAVLVSADFGGDADVVFDMYGLPDSNGTVVVQSGSILKTISLSAQGAATRL